jgi:hypothetical protein
MQGKRTRARDSRGRAVPGLYWRDGRLSAGFNCPQSGMWRMVTLRAETITEARRERDSILAGLREGRTRAPDEITVDALFADYQQARNLSERTRTHERHLYDRHLAPLAKRRAQRGNSGRARAHPARPPRPLLALDLRCRSQDRARYVRARGQARHPDALACGRARAQRGSEAAERATDRGPRRRDGRSPCRRGLVGALARGARLGRVRWLAPGRDSRPDLGRRRPRGRNARGATLDASERHPQGAEDGGRNADGADHAGASPPARRLAAALASYAP